MKKSVKLVGHVANSKIAIGSVPTLQISLGFVALLWSSDSYRLLKYRGGCTIPLFPLSVWCEKCVAARHNAVICKQLLISNDRNRVRWVVLGLSEDGGCADLSENLSVNSLKGDLSNATISNPPFFSLVNTFSDNLFNIFQPSENVEVKFGCRGLKIKCLYSLSVLGLHRFFKMFGHFRPVKIAASLRPVVN
jgi:hypothetical protein